MPNDLDRHEARIDRLEKALSAALRALGVGCPHDHEPWEFSPYTCEWCYELIEAKEPRK